MSGLVKPKEYNWKDSNLEFFGSDTEKEVKKESALTEPAWNGAGTEVGLQIWRIVKFKVTHWDKDLYGKFYNGDSFIILNTYKPNPKSDALAYDLHFWIGANSTQDEYGTAAYKTVELDTYLDDKAVQHREVEGFESELFHSYFKTGLVVMDGGADTGFHHVEPTKYEPRLLQFQGTGKNVKLNQVPAAKSRLKSEHVFILDMGLTIYQWNGKACNVFEKTKAAGYLITMKDERSGKAIVTEVLDEDDTEADHPFYKALTNPDFAEKFRQLLGTKETCTEPELWRVSGATGKVHLDKVKSGVVSRSDLDNNKDVFILDTPKTCFVWVGQEASRKEKLNGFAYAHLHLMRTANPLRSVAVVKEGYESKEFNAALAA